MSFVNAVFVGKGSAIAVTIMPASYAHAAGYVVNAAIVARAGVRTAGGAVVTFASRQIVHTTN